MKNTTKLFWLIALIAATGLGFTSCSFGRTDQTIVIVNRTGSTLKIDVFGADEDRISGSTNSEPVLNTTKNIAAGASETFIIHGILGGSLWYNIYSYTYYYKWIRRVFCNSGETVTAEITEETLYPWNTFKVTFDGNGGTGYYTQYVTKYGYADQPTGNNTKLGYTFAGWFTDNNTFENQWNFTENTVNESITLYAKWEAWKAWGTGIMFDGVYYYPWNTVTTDCYRFYGDGSVIYTSSAFYTTITDELKTWFDKNLITDARIWLGTYQINGGNISIQLRNDYYSNPTRSANGIITNYGLLLTSSSSINEFIDRPYLFTQW